MAIDWDIVGRAVHILAVVVWIGGVWLVTTVLLPGLRQKSSGDWAHEFAAIEDCFAPHRGPDAGAFPGPCNHADGTWSCAKPKPCVYLQGSVVHRPIQEHPSQHDGIVVRLIVRREYEGNRPAPCQSTKLIDAIALLLQFSDITSAKFLPAIGFVTEPLP